MSKPALSLSWLLDFCTRALPGPVVSDEVFEGKVREKIAFLKPLSIVRLCAEARVLKDHFEHTPLSVPSVPDLVTLVALTRVLSKDHQQHDLDDPAQVMGYLPCCNLYQNDIKNHEKEWTEDTPWPEKVLNALNALVIQTLRDNPKVFLVAWQPSEVLLHQVCVESLETANGMILMTLFDWLLTRLTDLFSGQATVRENETNPQDLWQSIADTQEMLDVVQALWLKNPWIPVDYGDYLKSHNLFEKKEFFDTRRDIFRALMAKG
ncbi:MAG: hypothetical protein ACKO43_03535 [Alphaproteobacteria bacterium]